MYKTIMLTGVIVMSVVSFSCGSAEKIAGKENNTLTKTIETLISLKLPELYNSYVDLKTLEILKYDDLIGRLKNIQIIYVAESHTNDAHHKLQENILRSISQKNSKTVLAMEFLYRSKQPILDDYINGKISEEEFDNIVIKGFGDWYKHYSPLIRYAHKNKLKLLGLNVEREIKNKMLDMGWDKLTPEEQQLIARDIDTTNSAHREYVMKQFSGMLTSGRVAPTMVEKLYVLQCIWDETFGEAIANYLKSTNDKGIQIIVVAGQGHINYKFNIPERSHKRYPATYRTIIPVEVGEKGIEKEEFKEILTSGIGDFLYFSSLTVHEPSAPKIK
jgi:uncharacterized iron-regulated protein